jgi:hypothetical protein
MAAVVPCWSLDMAFEKIRWHASSWFCGYKIICRQMCFQLQSVSETKASMIYCSSFFGMTELWSRIRNNRKEILRGKHADMNHQRKEKEWLL